MNHEANRIRDVYSFVANELETAPIVLYPGETWEVGTPKDSSQTIRK
jgi:hypothetical protein